MIIKAALKVEIAVFLGDRDEIAIAISVPGVADATIARLDPNHCEALELALRAARIESEARARG